MLNFAIIIMLIFGCVGLYFGIKQFKESDEAYLIFDSILSICVTVFIILYGFIRIFSLIGII